jgi:tubulin alpha
LSAIILARGELDVDRLARAGRKLIKKNKWVDHLPAALKIGVTGHKAARYHENEVESHLKKSVISYRSSMQISEILRYPNHNFDVMYGRRAFVHWFIKDGMEYM